MSDFYKQVASREEIENWWSVAEDTPYNIP